MTERDSYEVLQVHPAAHDVVIRAAYRALAALYHPDRDPSAIATKRMAEVNRAYASLRDPARRAAYDHARASASNTIPAPSSPEHVHRSAAPRHDRVDFGRYAGWTIIQLAHHDPDYLRWLRRHSSGVRYRAEIDAALAKSGGHHGREVSARRRAG